MNKMQLLMTIRELQRTTSEVRFRRALGTHQLRGCGRIWKASECIDLSSTSVYILTCFWMNFRIAKHFVNYDCHVMLGSTEGHLIYLKEKVTRIRSLRKHNRSESSLEQYQPYVFALRSIIHSRCRQ